MATGYRELFNQTCRTGRYIVYRYSTAYSPLLLSRGHVGPHPRSREAKATQPLRRVLLPRSSGTHRHRRHPKRQLRLGRLEPPGIRGLRGLPVRLRSRIRGADGPSSRGLFPSSPVPVRCSAGAGSEELRTSVLRRRDRRARGELESALPSPADARSCSREVSSPLPSPVQKVQQWRLFLPYACCSCAAACCCSESLVRFALHCLVCGVRLLNSKSSGRT